MKVRVTTVDGRVLLERHVTKFPATLGRSPDVPIPVADGSVSTRHCEFRFDGAQVTVVDLGSRNGVFFQGQKVAEQSATLPCEFHLGTGVIVSLTDAPAASAQAAAPAPDAEPEIIHNPGFADVGGPSQQELLRAPTKFKRAVGSATLASPAPRAEADQSPERYWHFFARLSARQLLLGLIGWSVVLMFFSLAIGGQRMALALAFGPGLVLGALLVAAFCALPFAVLGLLFRGSFDFRPIFFAQALLMPVVVAQGQFLRPYMIHETFGLPVQALSFAMLVAVSVPLTYMTLFTLFPHRWGRGLLRATMVLAALGGVSTLKETFLLDRQSVVRSMVVGDGKMTRGLAGTEVDVKTFARELRENAPKSP